MTTLTAEQIDERADVLMNVDEQACQGCGRSALDCDAAGNPGWHIDSEWSVPGPNVHDAPVLLAVIRCPECW